MEEEVDPLIKREKHKENGVTNVGCEDDFLDNPITDLIKKEVETGDSTKPHCFQDSDFHKKIVIVKQKSFMKVVGTTMVLESWNVNLLDEPLALNFVASMADSLAMELRQKECTKPVKLIKVIWSPPLFLPPPKPPDLSLHAGAVGKFPTLVTHQESLESKVNETKAMVKFQLKKVLCMGVAVGNCTMEEKQIFQNVQLSVNFLVSLLKKNWQNVRCLYLKSTMGSAIRVF
ncbi:60S ribosomal protein L10a-1 [Glycine soja]|uniref:60S ribosomal protein L10a-1 n=1 Tax=Glycine soja TaxID=3848 RepID=A0A445FIU6_GLYSO|nr:60S ribosomal protein L10a-1 [Glycine soja]